MEENLASVTCPDHAAIVPWLLGTLLLLLLLAQEAVIQPEDKDQ